ncbi:MAG: N-acetyltransferase [Spirochaetes bacterium]|nr:N-acetyltransferase [Spirochaetota bacterium]
MEINIRHARRDDLNAIVEIINQAIQARKVGFLNELSAEDRREWFNEHAPHEYPILVAEYNNAVLGWASISPYRKGRGALDKTVEVSCFIHADYRRRGVGNALLSEIMNASRELKKSVMIAIIFHTNTESGKLLEKHDFKIWGTMPDVAEIKGENLSHIYYGRKL